jgi:hypothetical protein
VTTPPPASSSTGPPLMAYVDESARHRWGDTCVYALAAVLVDEGVAARCRTELEQLRVGRARVLHWRNERPDRRKMIAATLAGLPVAGVVAVRFYAYEGRTERARRQCLDVLLRELERRGVQRVLVESRRAPQDKRDRDLLTGLRRIGVARTLTVSWGPSTSDPILWAADCVAGAVTWWFDDQPEYLTTLGERVELLEAP